MEFNTRYFVWNDVGDLAENIFVGPCYLLMLLNDKPPFSNFDPEVVETFEPSRGKSPNDEKTGILWNATFASYRETTS